MSESCACTLSSVPILLVDDEIQFLKVAEVAFRMHGFTKIITESDPREVENQLKIHPDIRIVFLDISMPFLSGVQILEFLTTNYPSITVVMISGNSDVNLAVECMKKGAYDYLSKPINRPSPFNVEILSA